jgi:uncharacterized protein (TIGR02145 family)
MKYFLIYALLLTFTLRAQVQKGVLVDSRNNREYQTVLIASKWWMAENLDVSKFRNGEIIPQSKTKEEWKIAGSKKKATWCYYNFDSANGKKYGKLYNWYAVIDPRGLAPEGWHIPTDQEWTNLEDNLGGSYDASKKLKSSAGWNGTGNNSSGFNALPGGVYQFNAFQFINEMGHWWTSTVSTLDHSYSRYLQNWDGIVVRAYDSSKKDFGASVRCVKN